MDQGSVFLARDIEAERVLINCGMPDRSIFLLSYQLTSGEVGFDRDENGRMFSTRLLVNSSIWDGSERPLRNPSCWEDVENSPYVWVKGPLRESRWRPRVSFHNPSPNLLACLKALWKENSGGNLDDASWDDPEDLLMLLARCAGEFEHASIWDMLQFQCRLLATSSSLVVSSIEAHCGELALTLQKVRSSEMPQW